MNEYENFVQHWASIELTERQSAQAHFEAVCRLLKHPLPHEIDPKGEFFAYEYGVVKGDPQGGRGYADVFYKGHFAIEYKRKGRYADLRSAYVQLQQYRENLFNPPLLVVCDIAHWEIHTNFPNTEKRVYKFTNAEIALTHVQRWLHHLFYAPEALHPDRNTAQVTQDAADAFQRIAENMRGWEADPERIAHFLTKLIFCLFAEDVELLPHFPNSAKGIFSGIIDQTRTDPAMFRQYVAQLFHAMADGGNVLLQKIPYFNGRLFENVQVEEVQAEALLQLANAANLNWASIELAIFGTLFERSLDPRKRAQLGAHYTNRDDILLIVEPVLMQPLRREWDAMRAQAVPIRAAYDMAETPRAKLNRQNELLALRDQMLTRLRTIKVLDPACGSGNFLYVALNLLLDMEKEVINDPLFTPFPSPPPGVHPRQLYGMEIEPIAHALASIVVWIGYIQWRQNNGYLHFTEPILEPNGHNIRLMDAILAYDADGNPIEPEWEA
ncbi:MAG: class I SAM-dependent DNA methyltransferase, partial [Anaerolineae bacterium]|nr:class I SAM-dependent DNA methyltransferase [Anaerolineae bacterium]